MTFHGVLGRKENGLFLSSYTTDRGVVKYIAATQFKPTFARRVFPCFDEPDMKARFKFSIVRPNDYISLFNTEKMAEHKMSQNETMDVYDTSRVMSTHSLAFVFCNYASTSRISKSGVMVSVYSPPEKLPDVQFSILTVTKTLNFFENYFGFFYNHTKLDVVVVPTVDDNMMAYWGIMFFDARHLYYAENNNTKEDKTIVVEKIALGLAYQWFGNLVTTKWWDELWLNEGLAIFLQQEIIKQFYPELSSATDLMLGSMENAIKAYSLEGTQPITQAKQDDDVSNVKNVFTTFSLTKGFSIINMLETTLGLNNILKALMKLFQEYQFKSYTQNELWEIFTQEGCFVTKCLVAQGDMSDNHFDVKGVVESWILQAGLPVVTITKNGRNLICKQERYLVTSNVGLGDYKLNTSKLRLLATCF
ncbi:hypothetical protein HELRODRAFT_177626 [Helobdella robusta]|uniref:Uncharacterized protein n=1 Tax=Helobdella robusta TaxID=6412 RepID=T1FBY4_HELRO|nr:hypothetical protein HELRODRAFT_177626 [Helobdella robusta]ESN97955.1 hypothetical protein HELRODRAFT_177626 [Helobdella robusta]